TPDLHTPSLHDALPICLRQMQLLESGDLVRNDAHYNGAASALLKNIHAKTRDTGYAIGKVSRAVLLELADRRLVLPHDVVGNRESVLRTETLQTLIFELHELAADFELRGSAGRENQ